MARFDNEAADDGEEFGCCNCCSKGHALLIGLACSIVTLVVSVILLVVDIYTGSLGRVGGYILIGVSTAFVVAMLVVTVSHYQPDACGCLSQGCSRRQTWPELQDSRPQRHQPKQQPASQGQKQKPAPAKLEQEQKPAPAKREQKQKPAPAKREQEQAAEEFKWGESVYPARW